MRINNKKLSEIPHGRALFWVDFILPFPLFILMFYLWSYRTQDIGFSLYVMLLPLLFGYIMPGIGTNKLKMWTFTWKIWRVGNYFIHHGFMYAPYFALSLYLTFGDIGELSYIQILTILISNAFLQCFLTTWHDYWAVKSGMIIIYNKAYKQGRSAAEIILEYGPVGYALFGFTYALSCIMAYKYLSGSVLNFILLLIAGLLIMGLSGLHYAFREGVFNKAPRSKQTGYL